MGGNKLGRTTPTFTPMKIRIKIQKTRHFKMRNTRIEISWIDISNPNFINGYFIHEVNCQEKHNVIKIPILNPPLVNILKYNRMAAYRKNMLLSTTTYIEGLYIHTRTYLKHLWSLTKSSVVSTTPILIEDYIRWVIILIT